MDAQASQFMYFRVLGSALTRGSSTGMTVIIMY